MDLPVEARFTLCNMAVEFGAWTGIIAPDGNVFDYIRGRPFAPRGQALEEALRCWKTLASDTDARFDREIVIDCRTLAPQVTWGTSPQHETAIDGSVPDPAREPDPQRRQSMERALQYMGLSPGTRMRDIRIGAAFIGSCTNSRISDLRAAAAILKGRRVAPGVKAICVPGSTQVKLAAEREGLDQVFREAGFEWRESGCSMCFYAGGESFGHEDRVVTSTNRNFENRQGPRTRSHLASPTTVAASAIKGRLADARELARP
jgi:3-isopropylmalate/(R)-2-methylmalate dehydratase large subunit